MDLDLVRAALRTLFPLCCTAQELYVTRSLDCNILQYEVVANSFRQMSYFSNPRVAVDDKKQHSNYFVHSFAE